MGATHNEVTLPGGTVHDLGAMRDDGAKLDRSMAILEVCDASGIRDKKHKTPPRQRKGAK